MNWKALLAVPFVFLAAPVLAVIAIVATLFIGVATGGGSGQNCVAAGDSSVQTLEVTSSSGDKVTLGAEQLQNARVIIEVAAQQKIPAAGVKIALITTLVESKLRMYANSTVPESLSYPHQAVGSDHDSLNPFQQRPSSGWGTVAELMDMRYAAQAFFGGPEGPNDGSPRGLLDIKGWESMAPGDAAQTVQVSAFPDRYEAWTGAAEIIVGTLGGGECTPTGGNGQAALPLNPPYMMTSGFGPRDAQGNASTWHAAVDLVNPGGACGKPVYAVLPGVVTKSTFLWLSIKHPDGFTVSYLHMYERDHTVKVGDQVQAGQPIGLVGNAGEEQGLSFGCHLDLRIDVSGNTNPQVAQLQTVADRGGDPNWGSYVHPVEFMRIFGIELLEAGQVG